MYGPFPNQGLIRVQPYLMTFTLLPLPDEALSLYPEPFISARPSQQCLLDGQPGELPELQVFDTDMALSPGPSSSSPSWPLMFPFSTGTISNIAGFIVIIRLFIHSFSL